MSRVQPIAEPWDASQTVVRLVLRLIGVTVGGYSLVSAGALRGPAWLAALSVLAVITMYVMVALRARPFDRWAMILALVMMLSAAVIAPLLNYIPLYFMVVGGVILVGQPQVPLARSVPAVAFVALVLATSILLTDHSWSALLSCLLGLAAVALFGANRRQSRFRERQDRELVIRSRELEQRSRELIAQTEKTQHEMARSAALAERGRIARDIHDVLAHSLGGLVVQLDAAEALLTDGGNPEAAAQRLRASRQLAVEGLRDARLAVQELHDPAAADPVDLVAELERLNRGPVAQQLGLQLDVAGLPYDVPVQVAQAFMAVCRESVTNLNKHAAGERATVSLVFEPGCLVLETVNALTTFPGGPLAGTGGGQGLPGLRVRMDEIGGTLWAGVEHERWLVRASWEPS